MLDKQTAIELAEGLGIETGLSFDGRLCVIIDECAIYANEYFTFERMALLALEYFIDVEHSPYINQLEASCYDYDLEEFKCPPVQQKYCDFDNMQRAYCMAVAKVLIEIKGSGE